MNSDISRIPIQSFGAVFSLTDILPELPLPSAFPNGSNSDSFLSDSGLSGDVTRYLRSKDEALVSILVESLSKVSTENIDFNDNTGMEFFENESLPPLLRSVLQKNGSVFNFKNDRDCHADGKYNSKWVSHSIDKDASIDDACESPTKRKHKKKKHRKRKSETVENNISSGGESTTTTPALSQVGLRLAAAVETANPTVSVNVNPNEKKILLTFSFKRPTLDEQKNNHLPSEHERHEKKRKEHKRHRSREAKQSKKAVHNLLQELEFQPTINADTRQAKNLPQPPQNVTSTNGLSAKPMHISSPNDDFTDKLNIKQETPTSALSHNTMINSIAAIESATPISTNQPLDLKKVFDQDKSVFNSSPTYNFINETFGSDALVPNNQTLANFIPSDLLAITSHFPLTLSNQPIPANNLSQDTNALYKSSFSIAAHLEYDSNQINNSFLDNIPPPNFPSISSSEKATTNSVKNTDIASLTVTNSQPAPRPMGLASYLNLSKPQTNSNKVSNAQINSINKSGKPPRRRAPVSKRRRCNELDGLRSWTVKYPTGGNISNAKDRLACEDSTSWDATVGSISQASYLETKRRKRFTRHPSELTSDFVFEHDKDYPKPLPVRISDGSTMDTSGRLNSDGDSESEVLQRGTRGQANKRSYAGMDDAEDVPDEECFKDPEGGRRRKKADDDENFEVRTKEPAEQRFPHLQKAAEQQARPTRERVRFKVAGGISGLSSMDSAASASSLKKFITLVDKVLESVEELDLLAPSPGSVGGAATTATNGNSVDDMPVPTEAIIPAADLLELSRGAAKLKNMTCANQVPTDRLLKLLTVLLLNIRDGVNIVPPTNSSTGSHRNRGEDADVGTWRELAMERVNRSINSSLVAINLMTSRDMPREIYLEDVIEQAVQVTRFQLSNCIYPEYDPAYQVDNSAKDNQNSIKFRRARDRETSKSAGVKALYYRLVEMVSGLAELVVKQRLTDSLVLTLSSLGVSIFFVENVSELQLAALKLVTGIFSQYSAYRKLIVDDIITSISRLPSSKKNLRTYRLNSVDSIQMFTALALLLVQSVIELPTHVAPETKASGGPSNCEANDIFQESPTKPSTTTELNTCASTTTNHATISKPDDEVLVTSSYKKALLTAHTFLSVFLRKSTMKGEDDYRAIFENFVNDLLLTVNKPEWPAAEVMLSLLGSLLVQQVNNKTMDQSVRVTSVDYLGTVASTLRRDAVQSQLKEHDIDIIIRELTEGSQSDEDEEEKKEDDDEEDDQKSSDSSLSESEVEEDQKKSPQKDRENEEVKKMADDEEMKTHKVKEEKEIEVKSTDIVSKKAKNNAKRNRQKQLHKEKKEKIEEKQRLKVEEQETKKKSAVDRLLMLRDATLDYLLEDESDPVALYACKFYMAQWLEDCSTEAERAQRQAAAAAALEPQEPPKEQTPPPASRRKKSTAAARAAAAKAAKESGLLHKQSEEQLSPLELAEQRRAYLLERLRDDPTCWRSRCRVTGGGMLQTNRSSLTISSSMLRHSQFKGSIDYEDAYLICRFLASMRPFSQSFDVYLSQICKLLSENSVLVRTKAVRCLSAVVEADSGVLARSDIELAVRSRLLDTSTSVREAAVDLLGRFLVCRPELTQQYYPMLSDRIRDKGVSVRKRVIRILRDICLEQPDFPRIAEICVKIIRRVNDEESVKKLVSEVFQTLWFTPVRDKESAKLLRKVMNITDVVAASKETGYEWFDQFLESLLTREEGEKIRPVERACVQIVECLVQNIMRLEEIPGQTVRLVACLATLHLFTKIRPPLMVRHAMQLQPYLSIRGHGAASDALILHYVARILEVTVPLVEHPSEAFLAQLEEDMVKLTLRQGKIVLESCVACLGAVVNKVSKNYPLARECFARFFNALVKFKEELMMDPEKPISPQIRPSILRALFTVGLLCKHFDTSVFSTEAEPKILNKVFEMLMFFSEQVKKDLAMRKKALSGLGFLCTRHHELLCGPRLCKFYHDLLQAPISSEDDMELKSLVLENILSFFLEEERRMLEADAKWKARHKAESLKTMGDIASGVGSHVAQAYLKDMLETFFSPSTTVRMTALSVVTTILRQGLISPVQTVPFLIAMQTDVDSNIRIKADAQLQEVDNKFPGFINMRAIQGACLSYRLQCVLYAAAKRCGKTLHQQQILPSTAAALISTPVSDLTPQATPQKSTRRSTRGNHDTSTTEEVTVGDEQPAVDADVLKQPVPKAMLVDDAIDAIRGSRDPEAEVPSALNSQLYSMLRINRGLRRSFLNGLLNLFDDVQNLSMGRLVYVADNLAFFPYQCQEEPLFIIHHIDLLVSMNGSTLLQSVREILFPEAKEAAAAAALAHQHQAKQANPDQECNAVSAKNTSSSLFTTAEESTRNLFDGLHCSQAAAIASELLEEEEDEEAMVKRVLSAATTCGGLSGLQEAIKISRACVLLLNLKQYLKEVYSITDSKIQKYSPSDSSKLWEKQLTRRSGIHFHPTLCLRSAAEESSLELVKFDSVVTSTDSTIAKLSASTEETKSIKKGEISTTPAGARDLVLEFFEFRKLILSIDPPDEEDAMDTSMTAVGDVTNKSQQDGDLSIAQEAPLRLPPGRSLVPQSHNKSSEEENGSEDSDAGGASRLLLAQSAPKRNRAVASNTRGSRFGRSAAPPVSKRRSTRQRVRHVYSSSEDSDEANSADASDSYSN